MIIANFTITLASQRDHVERVLKKESLNFWVDNGQASFAQMLNTAMLTRSLNGGEYSPPQTQLPHFLTTTNGENSASSEVEQDDLHTHGFSSTGSRGGAIEAISPIGRIIGNAVRRTKDSQHSDRICSTPKEGSAIDQYDGLDARWQAIKLIVEKMMGGKCQFKDIVRASQNRIRNTEYSGDEGSNAGHRFGWGLEYSSTNANHESERTSYTAVGTITTTDGKTINISLGITMSREVNTQVSVSIKAGDATVDPLTINLTSSTIQLTDTRYAFVLNSDRQSEFIPCRLTTQDGGLLGPVGTSGLYLAEQGAPGAPRQVNVSV